MAAAIRCVVVLLLCGCAWGQANICQSGCECTYYQKTGDYRTRCQAITQRKMDVAAVLEISDTIAGFHALMPTLKCAGNWKELPGNKGVYACEKQKCTDPDRILIGPDGHGKYYCHLPQTN